MDTLPEVIVTRPGAVDSEPKRFGLLRRYGPWLLLAVKVLAASWPALLPVLVLMSIAGPLGLVLGVGLVAGVGWRWGRYRRLLWRARSRVLEAVLRHQWPSICSLCGFAVVGDRRVRCPRLRSVEFGPGWLRQCWWRIELVPLAQHDEATWHRYGSRLQRQLGFAAHDQVTTEGAGSVQITFARNPLPIMAPAIRDQLGQTSETGRDRVLIGIDAMGEAIEWSPDDDGRGMLFVGGSQGGGKSNIIRLILAHGLATTITRYREGMAGGWRIVVADPAGVDFAWLHGLAEVATTPADMFAAILEVRDEIDRRADVMKAHRVNHWLKLPLEVRAEHAMAERLVLVVDELVALMAMKGRVLVANPDGNGRKVDLFTKMAAALADVGALGRKVGVSVVAATQHPIAEHLGPFGSTFKSNLGARIGTGALEVEGAAALFGKSDGTEVAAFLGSRIPGRMVTRSLSADGTQARRPGQALFVPDQMLEELATEARSLAPPALEAGGVVIPLKPDDTDDQDDSPEGLMEVPS